MSTPPALSEESLARLLDFSTLSSLLRDVLTSLHAQSQRTEKLEHEFAYLTKQHSVIQSSMTELRSYISRMSSMEESMKRLGVDSRAMLATQKHHTELLSSQSNDTRQLSIQVKESQTSIGILQSTIVQKADRAEVETKASANVVNAHDRQLSVHDQSMKTMEEVIERLTVRCTDLTASASAIHTMTTDITTMQQQLTEASDARCRLELLVDRLTMDQSQLTSKEDLERSLEGVMAQVSQASQYHSDVSKKEMKRFERDIVAYVNDRAINPNAAFNSSGSGSGHRPRGSISSMLTPLNGANSSDSPAVSIVSLKCLSCGGDTQREEPSAPSAPIASTATTDSNHTRSHSSLSRPSTAPVNPLPSSSLKSSSKLNAGLVEGSDGIVYRGYETPSSTGAKAHQYSEEKELIADTVESGSGSGDALAPAEVSLVFEEELKRIASLKNRKPLSATTTTPSRLMITGDGQLVTARGSSGSLSGRDGPSTHRRSVSRPGTARR